MSLSFLGSKEGGGAVFVGFTQGSLSIDFWVVLGVTPFLVTIIHAFSDNFSRVEAGTFSIEPGSSPNRDLLLHELALITTNLGNN